MVGRVGPTSVGPVDYPGYANPTCLTTKLIGVSGGG
ncbi:MULTISPECIES: ash family protein [unclassified Escherichia]|nr:MULTISPECIES: ash family protein [unclassified Escherichia]